MPCYRQVKYKKKFRAAINKKNKTATNKGPDICISCGAKYSSRLDAIVSISFYNVLYSTIFMRNKYNLSNLPAVKVSQFRRYCNQYASLFVCPTCESQIGKVYGKIYKAYKVQKKV